MSPHTRRPSSYQSTRHAKTLSKRCLTTQLRTASKIDDISFVDYQRLADILNQAPNLRALTVLKLDNHLSRRGSCLADTIANLQDLRALDLQDIDEGGFKLCRRLACRPDLVCLKGLIKIWMEGLEGTMVHFAVDRTALLGLPVFQHASVVALDGFSLLHGDGGTVDPWPNVRTLSLTNMDPLAVAAMCPNLTCLQLGYFCPEDDHFESFIHDREYPYSTDALGCTLGIRLRLLDIFVDSEESMPPRVIPVTIRATLPVVLSVRFPADATALWEELACTLRDTASRTRYLDVLFLRGDQPIIYSMRKKNGSLVHPGPPRTSPQEWLEKRLPLLAECGLLCLRLRLSGSMMFRRITPAQYDDVVARGADPLDGSGWEDIREAAPQIIARALPSLRYVAVASGYLVKGAVSPCGAAFAGETRWWGVMAGDQLAEMGSGEGARVDSYLRSEAFAETLNLPPSESAGTGVFDDPLATQGQTAFTCYTDRPADSLAYICDSYISAVMDIGFLNDDVPSLIVPLLSLQDAAGWGGSYDDPSCHS